MALIVQKFGGTSVGSIERIKNVAQLVKAERDIGNQVVVVVSAMSGVTDQLVGLVSQLSATANDNERQEYVVGSCFSFTSRVRIASHLATASSV